MRTIQLVIFFASVFSSLQQETVVTSLLKYLPSDFIQALTNFTPPHDVGKDIYALLREYGYKVETHWVTTEDGYVLRMQRIPSIRNNTDGVIPKPPVLLMHGLLSSSADWLLMGPNKSLPYMLAEAGYDVWLGNNRGNTWSRNHVTLHPNLDADKFWDFSFEDCGRYDLPAKIDYILEKTGQKQLMYVGFSQGTTQYFAMATLRPEYNEKIALMTALAPVAYMENIASPIVRIAAQNMDLLKIIFEDILHIHEVLGQSEIVTIGATLLCSDGSPFQRACATFLYFLCGFDPYQMDKSRIPLLATNAPAGISAKMLLHYGQEIKSGYFRRYDYGGIQNLAKYHQMYPPNFDLRLATAPVALYHTQNDLMAAVEDVERLAKELPNVVNKQMINNTLFNHLDFIFAKDVDKLVNREILEYFDYFLHKTTTESPTTTSLPTTKNPDNSAGFNVQSLSTLIFIFMLMILYL